MPNKVIEETIPTTSLVNNSLSRIDFSDTFSITNHIDNLQVISHKIFNKVPKWVGALMMIRNGIMKLLNMHLKMPSDYNEEWREGGYVGFFKIFNIQPKEVLLGLDDKHLNFRVSILNSEEKTHNIKVTTLVEYNNKFGRFYMGLVKPFHRIVVKSMIRNAYLLGD